MRRRPHAVLRQGRALRQYELRAARVPPDSRKDAIRHGDGRPAEERTDRTAKRLPEQAGQAVQRSRRL